MMTRPVIGVVVALLVSLVGGPAGAQDDVKAAKGVSVRNAVTSLGPFSATINAPLFISGTSVTLEPGGRTGRQQYRVPTYVYVVDGTLITEYEPGPPAGIAGAQYHAAGQGFMDNGGWWHNYFNRGTKPVTVILVHIGYPGRPDPILKPEPE